MTSKFRILFAASVFVLLSAGCAGGSGPWAAQRAASAPEAMVATIRAAAGEAGDALAVQPLRDPRVEDLRMEAGRLESAGDVDGAARALDQALEVVDHDPALLQERAELALLQRDYERAGRLAERAYSLGAQIGPLCRRHWTTLEQLRLREGDAHGAAVARGQVEGCRATGPERY